MNFFYKKLFTLFDLSYKTSSRFLYVLLCVYKIIEQYPDILNEFVSELVDSGYSLNTIL